MAGTQLYQSFSISEEFEEKVLEPYLKEVETDESYLEAVNKLVHSKGRGMHLRKKNKKNKHKAFKIKFAITQELQRIRASKLNEQQEKIEEQIEEEVDNDTAESDYS